MQLNEEMKFMNEREREEKAQSIHVKHFGSCHLFNLNIFLCSRLAACAQYHVDLMHAMHFRFIAIWILHTMWQKKHRNNQPNSMWFLFWLAFVRLSLYRATRSPFSSLLSLSPSRLKWGRIVCDASVINRLSCKGQNEWQARQREWVSTRCSSEKERERKRAKRSFFEWVIKRTGYLYKF